MVFVFSQKEILGPGRDDILLFEIDVNKTWRKLRCADTGSCLNICIIIELVLLTCAELKQSLTWNQDESDAELSLARALSGLLLTFATENSLSTHVTYKYY